MRLVPATQPVAPNTEAGTATLPANAEHQGRFSGEDLYLTVTVGVGLLCWGAAILIALTSSLAH